MIDFDFTYVQPKTIEEAHELYKSHVDDDKKVMYLGGGTEFISRARHGEIEADVVIDLKEIPECKAFAEKDGKLYIGAAVTLSNVCDRNLFPLLGQVARGIATRTERNKITVGGNLLSDLPYREALLPFLLAESEAVIATEKGLIKRSIDKLDEMDEGEFLVQIITDSAMTKAPFTYVKRTRQSNVNYPIVTTTSVQLDSEIRVAISGLCHHPIRSRKMEEVMRDSEAGRAELMDKLHKTVPAEVVDDELATRAYRSFVFEQTMEPMLAKRREA